MLGWLMVIASVMIMVKAADVERRSPVIWGAYTFICCVAAAYLMPGLPLVNVFLGLVFAFASMFAANAMRSR